MRDVPGWAQVFSAVIVVVTVLVTAVSWPGLIVAVLIVAAAVFATVALLVGLNGRFWTFRKKVATAGSVGLAVLLAVTAAVVAAAARPAASALPGDSTTKDTSGATLVESAADYRLEVSTSINTNDKDKVDLDTACPGRGPTPIQVGPSRCGENADLILDDTELITWKRLPNLALSTTDPTPDSCRRLLSSSDARGSVDVDTLATGSALCVLTDKGSIAVVRVTGRPADSVLEFGFEVWRFAP